MTTEPSANRSLFSTLAKAIVLCLVAGAAASLVLFLLGRGDGGNYAMAFVLPLVMAAAGLITVTLLRRRKLP